MIAACASASPLNDFALSGYVARIDFERDALFGVTADDLHLIGAAHLGARAWARGARRLGASKAHATAASAARCSRAPTCAHATGACGRCSCTASPRTRAMMRLARSQGMAIVVRRRRKRRLARRCRRPTPPRHFGEVFEQRVGALRLRAQTRKSVARPEEDEEAARVGDAVISTEEPDRRVAPEARSRSQGIATPISAASSRLRIMASAITPPSATLP